MAGLLPKSSSPSPLFQQAYEYAENMLDRLVSIHAALDGMVDRRERARTSNFEVSNGEGVCEVAFATPPGFEWLLERVCLTSPAGTSCSLYLDSIAPQNLLEVIPRAELYADAFANNIFIPQGRRFVFQFRGAGATRECFVALQLSRYAPPQFVKVSRYDIESA